jgi:hypothetical protein
MILLLLLRRVVSRSDTIHGTSPVVQKFMRFWVKPVFGTNPWLFSSIQLDVRFADLDTKIWKPAIPAEKRT